MGAQKRGAGPAPVLRTAGPTAGRRAAGCERFRLPVTRARCPASSLRSPRWVRTLPGHAPFPWRRLRAASEPGLGAGTRSGCPTEGSPEDATRRQGPSALRGRGLASAPATPPPSREEPKAPQFAWDNAGSPPPAAGNPGLISDPRPHGCGGPVGRSLAGDRRAARARCSGPAAGAASVPRARVSARGRRPRAREGSRRCRGGTCPRTSQGPWVPPPRPRPRRGHRGHRGIRPPAWFSFPRVPGLRG